MIYDVNNEHNDNAVKHRIMDALHNCISGCDQLITLYHTVAM